ncbi:MAG: hypothetical protein GXO91_01900 [FCB group bacterium]|nr:hypothetical protein [FCB group bacterium]
MRKGEHALIDKTGFRILKSIIAGFVIVVLAASCNNSTEATDPHVANADCAGCHETEQAQWASDADLHAQSAIDVLTTEEHNTEELLVDDCLKCHSSFQYSLGVAHFVTPVDMIGSPPGTWTELNASEWEATKCEVCHDPTSDGDKMLAKYGSVLDGDWNPGYISISDLPEAYQVIITGDETYSDSIYVYPDQTALSIQITRLCSSCHDPADQGPEPEIVQDGINYGPQGGDSRSYVMVNHQGFGCGDCHNPHDFTPVDPTQKTACMGCHPTPDSQSGSVHINHLL